jgi:hypothetical protein
MKSIVINEIAYQVPEFTTMEKLIPSFGSQILNEFKGFEIPPHVKNDPARMAKAEERLTTDLRKDMVEEFYKVFGETIQTNGLTIPSDVIAEFSWDKVSAKLPIWSGSVMDKMDLVIRTILFYLKSMDAFLGNVIDAVPGVDEEIRRRQETEQRRTRVTKEPIIKEKVVKKQVLNQREFAATNPAKKSRKGVDLLSALTGGVCRI